MGSSPYASAEPPKKGGKTWIVLLVVGCIAVPLVVAVIGIIAAIAIPSLLRARIAGNEAQAIGDIRTIISAEIAYQSISGGRFGTLECLEAPASCLKNYSGPVMLSPDTTKTEKGGFRRTFELSRDKESFTFLAVPLQSGSTGTRAFCGDSTGIICQTHGSRPSTSGGRCEVDASCSPLS